MVPVVVLWLLIVNLEIGMGIRRVRRDVEAVELITDWMLGVKPRKEFWETSRFLAWQRVDKTRDTGVG